MVCCFQSSSIDTDHNYCYHNRVCGSRVSLLHNLVVSKQLGFRSLFQWTPHYLAGIYRKCTWWKNVYTWDLNKKRRRHTSYNECSCNLVNFIYWSYTSHVMQKLWVICKQWHLIYHSFHYTCFFLKNCYYFRPSSKQIRF